VPFVGQALVFEGNRRLTCEVANLSTAGAYLLTADPLPVGAFLRLNLRIFGAPATIDLDAVVVRCDGSGSGVTFRSPCAAAVEAIAAWVAAQGRARDSDDQSQRAPVGRLVLVLGRSIIEDRLFEGAMVSIGRDGDNDVAIDNRSVSRRHCEIRATVEHAVVRDLESANGTLVNGRSVRTAVLREGDDIAVGKFLLLFRPGERQLAGLLHRQPAAAADREADLDTTKLGDEEYQAALRSLLEERKPHLQLIRAGPTGSSDRFPLDHGEIVLGRGQDADVPLEGRLIRARQARVVREFEDVFSIEALAQSPALTVNGARVSRQTLQDGDRIHIGANELVFRGGTGGASGG